MIPFIIYNKENYFFYKFYVKLLLIFNIRMYDYLYLNQKMNNKQKLFKLMHKVAGMPLFENNKKIKILVSNNKFQLIINNVLVGETKFNIEEPDEFFNENYVSIYELIIFEKFRNKG